MIDRLKPGTAAWNRRQAIHAHNGLLGNVRCIQAYLKPIMNSRTATVEARNIAARIWEDADMLFDALRTRDDHTTPPTPSR